MTKIGFATPPLVGNSDEPIAATGWLPRWVLYVLDGVFLTVLALYGVVGSIVTHRFWFALLCLSIGGLLVVSIAGARKLSMTVIASIVTIIVCSALTMVSWVVSVF